MFLISDEVLQAVGDYLIKRPYNEVSNLINALHTVQRYEANKPATEPEQAVENESDKEYKGE